MFVTGHYIICGFFILFSHISNSYVSEAEKWKRSDSGEAVYLFYDVHNLPKTVRNEDRGINQEHRKQIIHFARSTGSSLVVEDPSNLTNKHLSFADLHGRFNSERTAIHCITPLASQEDLLATSVEFRPETAKGPSTVSIEEVVEASEKLVKEIKSYQDGELLDTYYKNSCELYAYMLSRCEQLFQHISDLNKGVVKEAYQEITCPEEAKDVLREYYPDGYLDFLEPHEKIDLIVTYYNAHLIDAAMLHVLSEHLKEEKKSTVMFGGGAHLIRITPILTKMGYRLHESYVERYDSGRLFNLSKALKTIEPSYDPDEQLPKTAVDYFLAYKKWEAEHPTLKKFVPACTIAVWVDCYKQWKQEPSTVKKVAPVALAGTALVIICTLIKLYCGKS